MPAVIGIAGLVGAVLLPLFNIPLIVKIQQRKSSKDISLAWAVGVMCCLVLMLPSALVSSERIYRVFSVLNIFMFGAVVVQALRFR